MPRCSPSTFADDILIELGDAHACALESSSKHLPCIDREIPLVLDERPMHFQIELAVAPPRKHGLVHDLHFRALADPLEQCLDVLRI